METLRKFTLARVLLVVFVLSLVILGGLLLHFRLVDQAKACRENMVHVAAAASKLIAKSVHGQEVDELGVHQLEGLTIDQMRCPLIGEKYNLGADESGRPIVSCDVAGHGACPIPKAIK